jgi:ribosomal protein S3AE
VAIECRPDSRIIRECYEAAQKDYSIVKDIQDNVQNYLGSKEFEETINNFVLEKLAADIMHQIKVLTVDN